MAQEPFLTLPLRSCRDLIQVRHHARRVAQMLRFEPHDVIGVAAGALVVGQQARKLLKRPHLCFAILGRELRVFAEPRRPLDQLPDGLYTLTRPLPAVEQQLSGEDIGWLIEQVRQLAPTSLEEEIARQNQETLALLSALRANKTTTDSSNNFTAA